MASLPTSSSSATSSSVNGGAGSAPSALVIPSVAAGSATSGSSGSSGSGSVVVPVTSTVGGPPVGGTTPIIGALAASHAAASGMSLPSSIGTGGSPPSLGPIIGSGVEKKEIYTYEAPWLIYGMNWSVRPDKKFRLAIGSFVEEYNNKVEIIQLHEESGKFLSKGTFDHPYPTTKIMWIPDKTGTREDLLATTGDYLRIWKVRGDDDKTTITSDRDRDAGGTAAVTIPSVKIEGKDKDKDADQIKMKCLLNNNKNSEFCAPLTSFDWNETDPTIVGTSSIDTTCTIWNVETAQAKTQLIAHDKEVYDIAFAPSTDVFASCGADGSVRMFDLRALEHSTIIYESPELVPLLRLCWNKHDHNYLATFLMEQNQVVILDIRSPSMPVAELTGHTQCVNTIAWAPHSSCHICTGGDDRQALIWDLTSMPKPITEPILAYNAEAEINTLQWSSGQPEWVAITFNKKLQILRV